MNSKIIFASLLALSVPSIAYSADLSDNAILSEEVQDMNRWGGFYAGLQGGWAFLKGKDNSGAPGVDIDGGTYGGFAGYNFTFGNLVIGAELDAAYNDISKTSKNNIDIRSDWSAGLSGRIGYAFEAFMPYTRAGVGIQHGYQKSRASGYSDNNRHTYYEVGAGLETMVFENVSLRGEVLYRVTDKKGYKFQSGTYKGDVKGPIARVGVSYHF